MNKECQNCGIRYEVLESAFDYYKKQNLPEPKLCSACRRQRRYSYRNEWGLYKRGCSKCGTSMISMFPSEERVVYCDKCWWSDDFNPTDYGQEYDFNKSFFEQMDDLLRRVPLPRLVIGDCENSDYSNYAWSLKNCYLVSASDYCQDCMYSTYLIRSQDCVDCLHVSDCEIMYEAIDCKGCYSCVYCKDCRNCQDCMGCVGLRRAKYCILNRQYTKEEYGKYRNALEENFDSFLRNYYQLLKAHNDGGPIIENSENCTGNYLNSCKNCFDCEDLTECEDCGFCDYGVNSKDCFDCTGVPISEFCYESLAIPENYNLKFCAVIWPKSSFLEYCIFSRSSNNCFGCVSLRKNEYCILNKQYSMEEYGDFIQKIKQSMRGDYGEFFPMNISPFKYGDTMAQDYYPQPGVEETRRKDFNIIDTEKNFYEKMKLPLPKISPLERHRQRVKLRRS